MEFQIQSEEEKQIYFSNLQQRIEKAPLVTTKYLKLGVKTIKVQCYTPEILLFIEQHLTYALSDTADHFDETIIVWKETDIQDCLMSLNPILDPRKNMRLRVEMLYNHRKYPSIQVFENKKTVLQADVNGQMIEAYDGENHICYYGLNDFNAEELIKQGHLFVQILNNLLKQNNVNLTHGAVFGNHGNGILLCARGQRGKSTLTVHAMMHGFEYVSDDYQILEQGIDGLYAYPIYSIITLSPQMYNQMYYEFQGKFCCNNARKDKYVFNISHYHSQFKQRYPIRMGIFPEIVSDEKPSIEKCSVQDKGRAIVQFIHSTVMQMRDLNNHEVIKKLFNMVQFLPFYKFNLCHHIAENTEYLRNFLSNYTFSETQEQFSERILVDITFDLATFLDTNTFTLYSMNKFATNIYEQLISGYHVEDILEQINPLQQKNNKLSEEINCLASLVKNKGFLIMQNSEKSVQSLNLNFAAECDYKLSVLEFAENQTIELINVN